MNAYNEGDYGSMEVAVLEARLAHMGTFDSEFTSIS